MSSMPPPVASIPNHLAWLLTVTFVSACVCCGFGLIGIVGIVYASRVDKLLLAGDVEGAQGASNAARIWAYGVTAMAVIGVCFWLYVLVATDWETVRSQIEEAQRLQGVGV